MTIVVAGCASNLKSAARTSAQPQGPSDDPVVCRDSATELGGFWSAGAHQRVKAAILAVPGLGTEAAAELVLSRVDTLTSEWARENTRNCQDDSAVPARARAPIGRCLDEALIAQKTLVDVLFTADVDSLVNVESVLPLLSEKAAACSREPVYSFYTRPEATRGRVAAETAAPALARAEVLSRLKRKQDTETALKEASRAASATGDVRLQVSALIAEGTRSSESSQSASALELAKRALKQATAAKYLAGQAQATTLMAAIVADQGNPIAALEWLEQARPLYERVFGPASLRTSALYQQVGEIRFEQQEFDQALAAFQKALALRKPLLVPDHPLLLVLESKLGLAYRGKAEFAAALDRLSTVLERSYRLPLREQATADLYTNIGNIHSDRGDVAVALSWFEKARTLYRTVLGEEREGAGNTLNSIALAHAHQGNYEQALREYQATLALFEHLQEKTHFRIGAVCANIGTLHDEMGQYRPALEWHHKALAIFKQARGENHPLTAMACNNIGLTAMSLGDYRESMRWLERARMIKEATLGRAHPTTASTYNNIGLVRSAQKHYDEALIWHKKALAIEEQALGPNHPTTASSYQNIGAAEAGLEHHSAALEWFKKALSVKERAFGTEHPSTARTYNNIGAMQLRLGDYNGAIESHKHALAIRERMFGKDHPTTAGSYHNLGAVEATREHYDEALKWLKLALDIRQRHLGQDHPATRSTRENIERVEDLKRR